MCITLDKNLKLIIMKIENYNDFKSFIENSLDIPYEVKDPLIHNKGIYYDIEKEDSELIIKISIYDKKRHVDIMFAGEFDLDLEIEKYLPSYKYMSSGETISRKEMRNVFIGELRANYKECEEIISNNIDKFKFVAQ